MPMFVNQFSFSVKNFVSLSFLAFYVFVHFVQECILATRQSLIRVVKEKFLQYHFISFSSVYSLSTWFLAVMMTILCRRAAHKHTQTLHLACARMLGACFPYLWRTFYLYLYCTIKIINKKYIHISPENRANTHTFNMCTHKFSLLPLFSGSILQFARVTSAYSTCM